MDSYELEELTAWIAGFFTNLFNLTLIYPIIDAFKNKLDFKNVPLLLITLSYFHCLFWLINGKVIFTEPIYICFMISSIICLVPLVIYIITELKRNILDALLNILLLVLIPWGIYKYLTVKLDDDRIISPLCLCASIVFFLYYLYLMFTSSKIQTMNLIDFISSVILLCSSISWIIYGIISIDFYFIISYIIGAVFSSAKIFLYVYNKKKFKSNPNANNINSKVLFNEKFEKGS